MQCPEINFDDIPSSVSEFFTPEEFAAITDYERQHLSNLRQNFEALRRAGVQVSPPEFMLRNTSEKERNKLINPPFLESSDGSDSEWTPALEKAIKPRSLTQEAEVRRECRKEHQENKQLRAVTSGAHSHINRRKRSFIPPNKICPGNKVEGTQHTSVPSKQKKQRKKQTDPNYEEEEVHVYPFRKKRMTSYMSLAIPDDDEFLYCEECNLEYDGDCLVHGPLFCVDDAEVPITCPNDCAEYSKGTLPEGLVIKKSKIPKSGLGVFALKDFPARTRFGPYRGKKEINEQIAHESGYSWQIMKDGQTSHFVDGRDPSESNWMRFVNCARHEDEQCVTAYQYRGEIYYRAHKQILVGMEILVYYGDSYAKDLGIQAQKFGKLGRKVQRRENVQQLGWKTENNKVYSCTQCNIAFSELWYLQNHLKTKHKDKYWKVICSKMFGNLLPNEWATVENKRRNKQENSHIIDTTPEKRDIHVMDTTPVKRDDHVLDTMREKRDRHIIDTTPEKRERHIMDTTSKNRDSQITDTTPEKRDRHIMDITSEKRDSQITGTTSEKRDSDFIDTTPRKTNDLELAGAKVSQYVKNFKKNAVIINKAKISEGLILPNEHCSSELTTHVNTSELCIELIVSDTESSNLKTHKRIHTGEKRYKCDMCSACFTKSSHLKTHTRIHTGEKPYKCDICSACFTKSSSLKRHKRIHTGEKPYKCGICSACFTDSGNLKRHKRMHTEEKPYKCDICSVCFTQSGNLKTHKRMHTEEKPYKCDICSVCFTQSGNLKTHKRMRTEEKPYKCDICSACFTQNIDLKTHKRMHTKDKPYKCDICSVCFTQSSNLKTHKRMHTEEKPYKCDICSVCFTQSSNLKTHKRMHTGEKPYKCDICSACFTQCGHLKTHKRIHTGEKPYKCGICSACFTQSGNLKTHKRMRTEEKPYKCDICSACFTQNIDLKTHKRMHTEEKPYKCDICSVCFTQSSNLKTHKRMHTEEKLYKCDICSVCFTQSSNLKTHKRMHTGEKPYKCDICSACFTQCGHLKTHKRIHTGEKPYKCGICSACFTQNNDLKTHKRIHTGEKPYKCDICSACFTQCGHLKKHKRTHTGEKP